MKQNQAMDDSVQFLLLESIYVSIFLNLLLLLCIGFWFYKKNMDCENNEDYKNERFKKTAFTNHKLVVVSCVASSALSYVMLLSSCFHLHTKVAKSMVTNFSPAESHQMFLNFRGEDVRFNFVSHLTDAFERHGINYFIDVHEQRGKDLNNLFERIEDSSIAIALFSPRYAESKWCLDELVKMKTLADKENLIVIPIFYKVEAEDVSSLKGEFGEKFSKLAKTNPDRVTKWKDALESICSYMGMSLPDKSSEADFIKDIVKEVQRVVEAIRLEEKENLKRKGKQVSAESVMVDVGFLLVVILGLLCFMNWSKLSNHIDLVVNHLLLLLSRNF